MLRAGLQNCFWHHLQPMHACVSLGGAFLPALPAEDLGDGFSLYSLFFGIVSNPCLFFWPLSSPLVGFCLGFCPRHKWSPERGGPACLTGGLPSPWGWHPDTGRLRSPKAAAALPCFRASPTRFPARCHAHTGAPLQWPHLLSEHSRTLRTLALFFLTDPSSSLCPKG